MFLEDMGGAVADDALAKAQTMVTTILDEMQAMGPVDIEHLLLANDAELNKAASTECSQSQVHCSSAAPWLQQESEIERGVIIGESDHKCCALIES